MQLIQTSNGKNNQLQRSSSFNSDTPRQYKKNLKGNGHLLPALSLDKGRKKVSSVYQESLSGDKEVRIILQKIKTDQKVSPSNLSHLLSLFSHCKFAAYEFYSFLIDSKWKHFKRWIKTEKTIQGRRLLINLLERMILVIVSDIKKEFVSSVPPRDNSRKRSLSNRYEKSFDQGKRMPSGRALSNITNIYQNQKQIPLPQHKYGKENEHRHNKNISSSAIYQQLFKKSDLQGIVNSKYLIDVLQIFLQSSTVIHEERKIIQPLILNVISIVQGFKDREMYDQLSMRFITNGIFGHLISSICKSHYKIEKSEYKEIAKMLELCACHPQGISILQTYIENITFILSALLDSPLTQETAKIKYPAATVLLDLTASEHCIEKVAIQIQRLDMFDKLKRELNDMLDKSADLELGQKMAHQRYRDLMIGIVLNLSCNVENEEVTQYMITSDVVVLLNKILIDSRHDWPSNGAALALLYYSHLALSSTDLFYKIQNAGVFNQMRLFISQCRNLETKRHMYEALHVLKMALLKVNSIGSILDRNCYPGCA